MEEEKCVERWKGKNPGGFDERRMRCKLEKIARKEEREGKRVWIEYGKIRINKEQWIWGKEEVLRDRKGKEKKKERKQGREKEKKGERNIEKERKEEREEEEIEVKKKKNGM